MNEIKLTDQETKELIIEIALRTRAEEMEESASFTKNGFIHSKQSSGRDSQT